MDPDPADTSANACLTDGQIATLEFVYSRYRVRDAAGQRRRTFGMWLPNTDPSGSGLIAGSRGSRDRKARRPTRRCTRHLGVLGVTGFLMRDLAANPLDYVEGGPLDGAAPGMSAWLDSTNPDLGAFAHRGGKMIVTIGTNDTLASPGAQLDYYQSVLDTMGARRSTVRAAVRDAAGGPRPAAARNAAVDGDGASIPTAPIPNRYDKVGLLLDWVERGVAPPASVVVTAGDRTHAALWLPVLPALRQRTRGGGEFVSMRAVVPAGSGLRLATSDGP